MANPEHLKLFNDGPNVWDRWRGNNQEVADLSGADLSGDYLLYRKLIRVDLSDANLSGAYLREACLDESNLSRANLTRANFDRASLIKANLFATNLKKANLFETNLKEANLSEAELIGANLCGANLSRAELIGANLCGAYLGETYLTKANLSKVDLTRADLTEADLTGANLTRANLTEADLTRANLNKANLTGANLNGANLSGANFGGTNLTDADLTRANLSNSNLVDTTVHNATISKCNVYGVSVWDLDGEFKEQRDLIITPETESAITVDNIEVAQFIYLILNNKKIRDVINTLTSKTVLILGRFAIPERKAILDALRDKLREYALLPIVFDFDRPADKDFTETIKTLAGISYFVIADITNPKSSPLELQATVPDYQIPFVPIIQEGENPFAMMVDLKKKYSWVLDTISYDSLDTLIEILKPHIIDPAIKMRDKLRLIKAQEPTIISGRELKEKDKKGKP